MVANGRLEGIIEEVGGQLASRRPGCLIDAFESPCDSFDLFLSNLSTWPSAKEDAVRQIKSDQTL